MLPREAEFVNCISFDLEIGESPVWDDARGVLWFVDILKPAIYALDPVTHHVEAHPMPCAVGSIGLAWGGRLIAALKTGVHLFDPATGSLNFLVHPEPGMEMNRLNDGKVGPDGCFWIGSMHDALPRLPSAGLYRVTPDGVATRMLKDLYVSNGLAWSPDGQTLYHSDSRGPYVQAFDFDIQSGRISNPRRIITLDEGRGLPDGAAIDAEGYYWSAGVSAGVLNRISPKGDIVDIVNLPVPAPTMPCFGGTDLRTLFVTSLTRNRPEGHRAGTLISFRTEVPGLPTNRFGTVAAPS